MPDFIRSSKCTLKFTNSGKLKDLHDFVDEYRRVLSLFVDELWDLEKVPKFTNLTTRTWLSARAIQCAGKQASGIVRGTKKKHEQRCYRIAQLMKHGEDSRKLQSLTAKTKPTKPKIDEVCPELDARFVRMNWDNDTSYDGWVTLTSLGNKLKIQIPVRKHKQFLKWEQKGILKPGLRLSKQGITFMFECESREQNGMTLGVDVGIKAVISTSNGEQFGDLTEVNKRLARKKRGSKGFRETVQQRTNVINQSVNLLNLSNVGILRCENLKHVRKGQRTNRFLAHWTYDDIFAKLERKCQEIGVHIEAIPYSYTSQRCSKCGWTRKSNRKGLAFKCGNCGMVANADLNAALNIALTLPAISKQQRLSKENLEGFFWNERGTYSSSCPERRFA
jgi:predicted RNA-binding Zn-ribbon protein involved in translation (DUF1610 family)